MASSPLLMLMTGYPMPSSNVPIATSNSLLANVTKTVEAIVPTVTVSSGGVTATTPSALPPPVAPVKVTLTGLK